MEYKLVLKEHMFVLCVETKHCQVACGFDSDSCTYKTTEPNALKHWLCVPITYLNSQWSILLHPFVPLCNLHCKSAKVWKLHASVDSSVKSKIICKSAFCVYSPWASCRFIQIQQGQTLHSVLNLCNYLHCKCGEVWKLYANVKCSAILIHSLMNFCGIRGQVSALNKFWGAKTLDCLQRNYWFRSMDAG